MPNSHCKDHDASFVSRSPRNKSCPICIQEALSASDHGEVVRDQEPENDMPDDPEFYYNERAERMFPSPYDLEA